MKTLVIYDDNGEIFTQITGDYIKPIGLQHLETEAPEGKRITGVDVSVTPHQVILEDIPPSEVEVLRSDLEAAVLELSMLISMGGQ